jgi:hypothetical protein
MNTTMSSTRLAHNPLLAWREIEGEVVIISPEDSLLHELNSTASFCWKHLDGERDLEEIAQLIAAEYDVTPEQALLDTWELVASLKEKGLLRTAPVQVERA